MDEFSSHPLYRKHNIDSVMSTLWAFYTSRFVVLFIASFIMSLGLQFLTLTFDFKGFMTITDPLEMVEKLKGMIWPMVAISLIGLLCTTILHYYVIYSPIDSQVTIFSSIYKSLKYFIPYLIITILLGFIGSFAMLLGLLVIIIGIFFAILYMVTLYLFVLPVLMVEGTDIGHAIGRTFTLAHRGFWSNIGWVAAFLVILMIASMILSTLILLPFSGSFLKILTNPEEASSILNFMTNPIYLILTALVRALYFPMLPILGTILYLNGRAKEQAPVAASENETTGTIRAEDLYAKPYSDDNPEKPEDNS